MKVRAYGSIRSFLLMYATQSMIRALHVRMAFCLPRNLSFLFKASYGYLILQYFLLRFLPNIFFATSQTASESLILSSRAAGEKLLAWGKFQVVLNRDRPIQCRLQMMAPLLERSLKELQPCSLYSSRGVQAVGF